MNQLIFSAIVASTVVDGLTVQPREVTFDSYYKTELETYGKLDLNGYVPLLDPSGEPSLISILDSSEPVSVPKNQETDIETYASACANVCTNDANCVAFLIAFQESRKECNVLTKGDQYQGQGRDVFYDTPQIEQNFKQLYFKKDADCGPSSFLGYEASGEEGISWRFMGCNQYIKEKQECGNLMTGSWVTLNGNGGVCDEGGRCVALNPNTSDSLTCENKSTVQEAEDNEKKAVARLADAKKDLKDGVYDELTTGEYSVDGYKTLRSKVGNTTFFTSVWQFGDLKEIELDGDSPTADAFAHSCGQACDSEAKCSGFTIVWQSQSRDANRCHLLIRKDYSAPNYSFAAVLDGETPPEDAYAFLGQLFVPKHYESCNNGDYLQFVWEKPTDGANFSYVKSIGCSSEPWNDCKFSYDASNDKYGC